MKRNMYKLYTDSMIAMCRKATSKRVKKMFGSNLDQEIIETALSNSPGYADVVMTEEMFLDYGSVVIFPETPALLNMLLESKMSVRSSDIEWDLLPHVFSIAWPSGEVGGRELRGCLVNRESARKTVQWSERSAFCKGRTILDDNGHADEHRLHFYYRIQKDTDDMAGGVATLGFCESSMDDVLVDQSWFTPDDYMNPEYNAGEAELLCRAILRLIVYMQACPEYVKAGFPPDTGEKQYRTKSVRKPRGMMVGAPEGLTDSTGRRAAHWRSWHFRSFPMRKNGTKRPGIVAVRGTVVGAKVDPVTVLDRVTQGEAR